MVDHLIIIKIMADNLIFFFIKIMVDHLNYYYYKGHGISFNYYYKDLHSGSSQFPHYGDSTTSSAYCGCS